MEYHDLGGPENPCSLGPEWNGSLRQAIRNLLQLIKYLKWSHKQV